MLSYRGLVKKRHLEFYLESNSGLFASENFEEKGNPVIKEYCKRKEKIMLNNSLFVMFFQR